MDEPPRHALAAAAAAGFVLAATSYLLLAIALRYATVETLPGGAARFVWLAPLVLAAAFVHERLVRGALYARLRARLASGLAAPAAAVIGAITPSALRLTLLPRAHAPFAVVGVQALLVELFLGLGLTWLALGTGGPLPGAFALAAIWLFRLSSLPVFHGGVVPLLEIVSAGLAAGAVALILSRPLAPHRDAVLGVS